MDPIGGVSNLLGISRAVTEEILWSLLLLGLVAACVQLVTMLVSQWGERDLTWKALLFSLLVHLSCGAGMVAVSRPPSLARYRQVEEPVPVHRIFVAGEETARLEAKGNRLRRIRQTEPVPPRLTRRAQLSPSIPAPSPERTVAELQPPEVATPLPVPLEPATQPLAPIPLRRTPDSPTLRLADAEPAVPEPSKAASDTRPRLRMARDGTPPARIEVPVPALTRSPVPEPPSLAETDAVGPVVLADPAHAALDVVPQPRGLLGIEPADRIRRRRLPAPPSNVPTDATASTTERMAGGNVDREISSDPVERLLLGRRAPQRTGAPASPERPAVRRSTPDALAAATPADDVLRGFRAVETPAAIPQPRAVVPAPLNRAKVRPQPARPPEYRLRSLATRREIARRYGGTDATEQAVERALRWLARHQDASGAWDADGFMKHCPPEDVCDGPSGQVVFDAAGVNRQRAGIASDTGITGLALLAFLGAGYTHEEGEYAEQVERGLRWLIDQQRSDGFLGGRASHFARMYCHAMAAYALAEAAGMTRDRPDRLGLKPALRRAVAFTIAQQNPVDGGWRYVKGQRGDMSMFGWQLMALKSAEIAGLPIPKLVRERMIRFLKDRSLGPRRGLAAYRITDPPLPPTPAMTAEAWFCKQMLGIRRDNPACAEAAEFLLQELPRLSRRNLYYWYYGTLAMYQHGGSAWQQWNAALQNALLPDQRTEGHAAGSWEPLAPWGPYGGRVYATALATLSLEVYYRFLPLYRLNDPIPGTRIGAPENPPRTVAPAPLPDASSVNSAP